MRFRLLLGIVVVLAAGGAVHAGGKIPDKGKRFAVPYKLTDTAHVMVRVKINGKGPFNYIIDTGAPVTFVSTAIAKKLGIKPDKKLWATVEQFEVEGGVVNRKTKLRVQTPFQLEGMNAMNFAGVELHGIIGYDLLARYRLHFDFSTHKMQWTRLDFKPPPPQFISPDSKGAPGGLSALGGIMKILSMVVGKKITPKSVPSGFVGLELREKDKAIIIASVYSGSPAAKAGLKSGDRIVEVQGKEVASIAEVSEHAAKALPDDSIEFLIRRGAENKKITVTAGEGL